MSLTADEQKFYHRHTILDGIGEDGQEKLKNARVLVVGAGGLGAPVLYYLAAAGIGTLGIVDFDSVDVTNLHRQVIHNIDDVGKFKLDSAKEKLQKINPYIKINLHHLHLNRNNIFDLIENYEIIVDGTDNFPTRYLINDAAVIKNKIVVHGSIEEFAGQITIFGEKNGPCYRCVFPEPPDPSSVKTCSDVGVFGVLPAVVGSIQATETVKYILDIGNNLSGRLLNYDAKRMKFIEFKIKKSESCPVCGDSPEITELIDYVEFCEGKKMENTYEVSTKNLDKFLLENPDITVVDVRDFIDIPFDKFENVLEIPHKKIIFKPRLLKKEKKYLFVCTLGKKSREVFEMYEKRGFRNIYLHSDGLAQYFYKEHNS